MNSATSTPPATAAFTATFTVTVTAPTAALQRAEALLARGGRRLLGIVGPPGAGKSSLAEALHRALPAQSQVVPMDGFHYANVSLQRLGRADRKGAPDTFDAAGFAALLRRLRAQRPDTVGNRTDPAKDAGGAADQVASGILNEAANETVYAPEFRREIEEPIAGAIAIEPGVPLLIVEGNYLLLQDHGWQPVAALLDEIWYVEVDPALRLGRLIRRHEQFGRSPDDARAWVASTDEPNARLIEATRERADWIVRWDN